MKFLQGGEASYLGVIYICISCIWRKSQNKSSVSSSIFLRDVNVYFARFVCNSSSTTLKRGENDILFEGKK